MKRVSFFLLSILLTLAAWAWVAWPLPMNLWEGICSSPSNPGNAPPQEMVAGDHLQLMYQFQLAHDSWFGPTPMGYNLYEFNVGDDEARRVYTTYYFPYNLTYGIGKALGSQALGWNLSGLFSIWIGLVFTALFIRRYVPGQPWITWGAALAGQLIPYRWHTLLNGSPTGLALMWIPVVLFGLDVCIRDRKRWGAVVAGAAVFFSGWSDTHALFFGALLCALWALPTHWHARKRWTLTPSDLLHYAKAGWPLVLWAGLVVLQAGYVKASVKGTNTESGRSEAEVALFSPHWEDAVAWSGAGGIEETFLGLPFALMTLCGLAALLWQWKRKNAELRTLLVFSLLAFGILATTLLATGVSNPWGAPGWAVITKLVPPLGMLRQPAKIYLSLCPLIGLLLALGLSALPRRWVPASVFALVLLLGLSWTWRFHPTICLLDRSNSAYAAVAKSSEKPGAMALPLWPGDSHWSSLYQHYASLYRIRMVNGYRPSRMHWYQEDIFNPYEQFNSGIFPNARLDELRSRDIEHFILHEDAFPEKVSPFAVGQTLAQMMRHPRLRHIVQDGPIHTFQILKEPDTAAIESPPENWKLFGIARRWNSEYAEGHFEITADRTAFRNKAILLREKEDHASLLRFPIALDPAYSLCLRTQGNGRLSLDFLSANTHHSAHLPIASPHWVWQSVPLPTQSGEELQELRVTARAEQGNVLLDLCTLIPSEWTPAPATPITFPAPVLFHAGHTDLENNVVVFESRRDPPADILYGPNLPLVAGRYTLDMSFTTDAADGTRLGDLHLRNYPRSSTPVIAGQPVQLEWDHPDNELFTLAFRYHATEDMRIAEFLLTPEN